MTPGIEGLNDFVEIGRGGFATVYSAYQPSLNRRVAVKVLAALNETGLRRFSRELRSMGTVDDHPNIVTPLASGFTQPDGRPFVTMEFMAGGSLEQVIDKRGPLPLPEAIGLVAPIADALGHSHQAGILHRDVKPANILLSRTGVVKLCDFGIASISEATLTQAVSYSVAYAPPETFEHDDERDPRDERSDLYSLAATLHALVAGQPPFVEELGGSSGNSVAGHLLRIINDPVPTVGHPDLDQFLATAMAKAQDDRFPTAGHFAEALRAVGEDRHPTPASPPAVLPAAQSTVVDAYPTPAVVETSPPSEDGRGSRSRALGTRALGTSALVATLVAVLAVSAVAALLITRSNGDGEPGEVVAAPSTSVTERGSTGSPLTTGQETSTTEAESLSDDSAIVDIRTGHSGPVLGMAVLPDGRIASIADGGNVHVWNPDDVNSPPVVYEGARTPMASLADGRVVVGGPDETVHVWNPDSPSADPVVFTGQERELQAVTALADGRVASGSFTSFTDFTGRVYVWDPADAQAEPFVYSGHDSELTALAELPDGRIVSASGDQTIHVWDPDDPSAAAIVYREHPSTVVSLLALPDGRVLSGGLDRTVRLWNPDAIEAGQEVFDGHLSGTDGVYSLALLPDGRVASASPVGTVQVWDPDNIDGPAIVYSGHDDDPETTINVLTATVVVLSDNRLASVAGGDQIHVWDPDVIASAESG